MELTMLILFWVLIGVSLIGCFIAKFPSSLLTLAAVLIAKFGLPVGEFITWGNLALVVALVVLTMIITKMAPKWGQKISSYSSSATKGTVIGSILGLCIAGAILNGNNAVGVGGWIAIVIILILIPFVIAAILEFLKQKDFVAAMKSAGAATTVYACTAFLKLITVCYAVYLLLTNNA